MKQEKREVTAVRGEGNVPREPNLWLEIKHAGTYGHSEYRSRIGVVVWWPKDGEWHLALPGIDCFGKLNMLWTDKQFPNPESAMVDAEREAAIAKAEGRAQ